MTWAPPQSVPVTSTIPLRTLVGIGDLTLSQQDFTCQDVGINTVTLTRQTDAEGNTSVCTATVTVEDNTPPQISCLNVTIHLDADGNGSTTLEALNGGASDACGPGFRYRSTGRI